MWDQLSLQRKLIIRQVTAIVLGVALIIGVITYYAFNRTTNSWGWIYVGFSVMVGILVCILPAVNNLIRYHRARNAAAQANSTNRRNTIAVTAIDPSTVIFQQTHVNQNQIPGFFPVHLHTHPAAGRPEPEPEMPPEIMSHVNYNNEAFNEPPPAYDDLKEENYNPIRKG